MKKTLYYNVICREHYHMYNDGFLIVDIEDERILSIEGILTCDYIKAEGNETHIIMKYYNFDYSTQTLMEYFMTIIPQYVIEKIFNIRIMLDDGNIIDITTTRKITNKETKKKYKEILKEFKENSVFQKER